MIHLTPYRQNETSLSPMRGKGMVLEFSYREQINSFYPIFYINPLNMTEVFHIMSNNRQTSSLSSTAYEKVEVLNGVSIVLKAQFLLGINIYTISKRQNLDFLYGIINQLKILFRTITLLSRISLMISSAERSSFQAPANRFAQSFEAFFLAADKLFTYLRTFAKNFSSLAISPIARYNSAFSSIVDITEFYLLSNAKVYRICETTKL